MSEYITIKEACGLTGKSDKTIRRNIINVQDKLNLTSQTPIVSKKMSKYVILKSYLIEFYGLNNVQDKLDNVQSVTRQKENNVQAEQPLTEIVDFKDKYIDTLEKQLEIKDNSIVKLENANAELIRQNHQSQLLIGDLQLTNKQIELKEKESEQVVEVPESNNQMFSNKTYWVLLFILFLFLLFLMYLIFTK